MPEEMPEAIIVDLPLSSLSVGTWRIGIYGMGKGGREIHHWALQNKLSFICYDPLDQFRSVVQRKKILETATIFLGLPYIKEQKKDHKNQSYVEAVRCLQFLSKSLYSGLVVIGPELLAQAAFYSDLQLTCSPQLLSGTRLTSFSQVVRLGRTKEKNVDDAYDSLLNRASVEFCNRGLNARISKSSWTTALNEFYQREVLN